MSDAEMTPEEERAWIEKQAKQVDMVAHPPHYQSDNGIECIDAIRAALGKEQYEGYLRGACFKYLWRYDQKGGVESLKKAAWYLNKLIDAQ